MDVARQRAFEHRAISLFRAGSVGMAIVVRGVFISFGFIRGVNDRLRAFLRLPRHERRGFFCGLRVAGVPQERVVRCRRGLLEGDLRLITFYPYRFGSVEILFVERCAKTNDAFVQGFCGTGILTARRADIGDRFEGYPNGEDRDGDRVAFRLAAPRLHVRRVVVRQVGSRRTNNRLAVRQGEEAVPNDETRQVTITRFRYDLRGRRVIRRALDVHTGPRTG